MYYYYSLSLSLFHFHQPLVLDCVIESTGFLLRLVTCRRRVGGGCWGVDGAAKGANRWGHDLRHNDDDGRHTRRLVLCG